jgi:hypothetical protein
LEGSFVKSFLAAVAAIVAWSSPALAADTTEAETAERYRAAMKDARWTGPLLASNANTLPKGHVYTEPYFFDGISGGDHSPGSSGFYQYGLTNDWTVGFQPFFSWGTQPHNRTIAVGDTKLLSQVRVSNFTPDHRVPSVSIVTNLVVPTGKYDRLGANRNGHGSGAFAPEIGVNVQHIFLVGDRLLRGRINVLQRIPIETDVRDRSVYGTPPGFRGHARPGAKSTLILGAEYSLTKEWVLAFDIEADAWGKTRVRGRDASGAQFRATSPSSWNVGFAPAVEYNWSDRAGAIFGVWIVPKGHNSAASVTPAIAVQRFW